MNEQQIEAVEKLAKVFPRGVLVLTFLPNDSLDGRIEHPEEKLGHNQGKKAKVSCSDVYALDSIRDMIIDFWETGNIDGEEGVF